MKRHLKAGKLHLFHGSIEQAIQKNAAENDELFTVASLLVRRLVLMPIFIYLHVMTQWR